jgi:hypothetical protein
MTFYWLKQFYYYILWLVRPPAARDVARIDPNAPCPVCGARRGQLHCVVGNVSNKQKAGEIFCEHICDVCGARTLEQPIVKDLVGKVIPPPIK